MLSGTYDRHQDEVSTIEKLVEFLEGEDDSQGFFLNLAISSCVSVSVFEMLAIGHSLPSP